MEIKLNKIEDIVKFVQMAKDIDAEITIESNKRSINAKSLLGLFTVDLKHPIKINCNDDSVDLSCFSIFLES